jgi:hypothetical protein
VRLPLPMLQTNPVVDLGIGSQLAVRANLSRGCCRRTANLGTIFEIKNIPRSIPTNDFNVSTSPDDRLNPARPTLIGAGRFKVGYRHHIQHAFTLYRSVIHEVLLPPGTGEMKGLDQVAFVYLATMFIVKSFFAHRRLLPLKCAEIFDQPEHRQLSVVFLVEHPKAERGEPCKKGEVKHLELTNHVMVKKHAGIKRESNKDSKHRHADLAFVWKEKAHLLTSILEQEKPDAKQSQKPNTRTYHSENM